MIIYVELIGYLFLRRSQGFQNDPIISWEGPKTLQNIISTFHTNLKIFPGASRWYDENFVNFSARLQNFSKQSVRNFCFNLNQLGSGVLTNPAWTIKGHTIFKLAFIIFTTHEDSGNWYSFYKWTFFLQRWNCNNRFRKKMLYLPTVVTDSNSTLISNTTLHLV